MTEPYLGSAGETKAVLAKFDRFAKKKYGQNFLIDKAVLEATVKAAGLTNEDHVIEVGPGIGTLTQYLAANAGFVTAVEIDSALLPVLEETLAPWDNVRVVNKDILKTDIRELTGDRHGTERVKVVANLPYYITTPILMELLEKGREISSITVMVQKEVAERIVAGPGTKAYGALSLACGYYASPEIVRIVHPSSFMPQPGVDSAVVHLPVHEVPPVRPKDPELMFAVIRASFNQRRKKLANGLAGGAGLGITKEEAERALATVGLSPNVRGETLSLEQFADLSDALSGGEI